MADHAIFFKDASIRAAWTPPVQVFTLADFFSPEEVLIDQNRVDYNLSTISDLLFTNKHNTINFEQDRSAIRKYV